MEAAENSRLDAWLKAQSRAANAQLAALEPVSMFRDLIEKYETGSTRVGLLKRRGQQTFVLLTHPGTDHATLFLQVGDRQPSPLLSPQSDPGDWDNIDYFEPSPSGALVAIGLSKGGSEDSTLRVLDVRTGRWLDDQIPHTQYANLSWLPGERGFVYWRANPKADATAEQDKRTRVYRHLLGRPSDKDEPVFGWGLRANLDLDEAAMPYIRVSSAAPEYAIAVSELDTIRIKALFIAPTSQVGTSAPRWRKVADLTDNVSDFAIHGQHLYMLIASGNGRILRTPLAAPDLAAAETIVPEGAHALTGINAASDALYVLRMEDGIGAVTRVPWSRPTAMRSLALDEGTSIEWIAADTSTPGVLAASTSWTRPSRVLRCDPTGRCADTELVRTDGGTTAPPVTIRRLTAASADGTEVPITVVYRSDLPQKPARTFLDAYGAYGVPITPSYRSEQLAWIEAGGVYAAAHVRGGGERGEAWHRAAQRSTKYRSAEDYLACARELIRRGITTPSLLVAHGGSAGALTVGPAVIREPRLFAAALLQVPVANPYRFEHTVGGPANIAEFGTVRDPAERRTLARVDPYLQVRDGVEYPAILITTAVNDVRVPTWQPGKLAARLQEANASRKPILLRVEFDSGHGLTGSRSVRTMRYADLLGFAWAQLGTADQSTTTSGVGGPKARR
jgi:prolyl oligopeptidase